VLFLVYSFRDKIKLYRNYFRFRKQEAANGSVAAVRHAHSAFLVVGHYCSCLETCFRVRRGRKLQVYLWNVDDICHTFGHTNPSGLCGHTAISGCPLMSCVFVDTFFELAVV